MAGTADVILGTSSTASVITVGLLNPSTGTYNTAAGLALPAGNFTCNGSVIMGDPGGSATTTTVLQGGFQTATNTGRIANNINGLAWAEVAYGTGTVGSTQTIQLAVTGYSVNQTSSTNTYINDAWSTGAASNTYFGGGMLCVRLH